MPAEKREHDRHHHDHEAELERALEGRPDVADRLPSKQVA
jgi:hypothetical protein